jgi:hypothetical protein
MARKGKLKDVRGTDYEAALVVCYQCIKLAVPAESYLSQSQLCNSQADLIL